jgi:hypothetical protein
VFLLFYSLFYPLSFPLETFLTFSTFAITLSGGNVQVLDMRAVLYLSENFYLFADQHLQVNSGLQVDTVLALRNGADDKYLRVYSVG